MRAVFLGALVFATGCDGLFGLTHLREPAGDDDGDASIPDAPADSPTDATPDTMVDAYVQKSCMELGYVQVGGYGSFRAGGAGKSWLAAENDCADDAASANTMHTHLAVLVSDQEANAIWTQVFGSDTTLPGFWIGLADTRNEGAFRWVTDESASYPYTTTWRTGEPNGGTAENCAWFDNQVKLYDRSCTDVYAFVCECDSYAVQPNNF